MMRIDVLFDCSISSSAYLLTFFSVTPDLFSRMTEDHLQSLQRILRDEKLMKRQHGHVPFRDKLTELIKYIFTRGNH
jgi:hypothetical protein